MSERPGGAVLEQDREEKREDVNVHSAGWRSWRGNTEETGRMAPLGRHGKTDAYDEKAHTHEDHRAAAGYEALSCTSSFIHHAVSAMAPPRPPLPATCA